MDPRAAPDPSAGRPSACTTPDGELLEGLHELCRQGRLYDIERWVAGGQPLQLEEGADGGRRRRTTALEIALRQQNHALALLLLCNGYDSNLEPQGALDLALVARRPDLVELLLVWGTNPHRVDRERLFDTYESSLFERFYRLGVDLTARHALAEALGYHTSNKPLYGFAKRHHEADPRIQRELDIALAHHAGNGNERGALLCLWAGADPHARVPMLGYDDEDDGPEEDEGHGGSAVFGACFGGHVGLLERFAPDPARENFDRLYPVAQNAGVVEVLARSALATDVTAAVRGLTQSSAWSFGGRDAAGALRRLFELGARWVEASPEEVGEVRRSLLRAQDYVFEELVLTLGTEDYCAAGVRHELARTGAFQKRMQVVGLMPREGDRGWDRRHGAEQARAVLTAFGLDVPRQAEHRSRRQSAAPR